MEKIVNLQMPGSLPAASTQTRSVQSKDAGDGFLTMLQQKQETQETKPKTDEPTEPVKETGSQTKDEPKKEPADLEKPEEDAQQLALELAAQQAAVQNAVVTADWQEQPVQTEVLTETLAALEEIPAVELQLEQQPETVIPMAGDKEAYTPERTEAPVQAAEELQQPAVAVQQPKAEEGRENPSAFAEAKRQDTGSDAPKSAEPVREAVSAKQKETVSTSREESPQITDGQTADSGRAVQQTTDSFDSVSSTEGTVVKATVEELPQELGKALASARTAGSQTLTVELEPAALGKLTIKVVYEAGRAAVSIAASNPRTLELLSEKATEIASILKERTGEETVIYTHQPQQQEADQYEDRQGGSRGQNEQKQRREEERQQTESFAQQLRLGLV